MTKKHVETNGMYGPFLDYKDVFIFPDYSEVKTRKDVDVGTTLKTRDGRFQYYLSSPVISSNMDTVTGSELAFAMSTSGAIGALHRFLSIEENVKMYELAKNSLVSVGVNGDSMERAEALYKAGARFFVIDIAHGHSKNMGDMLTAMRQKFGDNVHIMAGNVGTPEGARYLYKLGADSVKIGIGPGNVCLTKNVTGVTVPIFSCVMNIANAMKDSDGNSLLPLVADGGINEYGDIAKAIGAGAHMVMCGKLFAGTDESLGVLNIKSFDQPTYRGMASRGAMEQIRAADNLPTPEGKQVLVERKGPVGQVVKEIRSALQSSFSYVGATNQQEFQAKVRFGMRK